MLTHLMVLILVSASSLISYGVDLGKYGTSFEIKEEAFTEMMKRKMEEIDMEEERQKMQNIAKRRIENPISVIGIKAAVEDRTIYFDPTYVLEKDVVLPNGKILYRAGSKVNPLEYIKFDRRLLFIDASNKDQVNWLKAQLKDSSSEGEKILEDRVILVGGSVFKLQEELGASDEDKVFFDQNGELTTRFGIKFVPAIAKQEGTRIRIDEVSL